MSLLARQVSIYINDLPLSISSTEVDCDMFPDDSFLSASGNNIAAINAKLQPSIQEVTEWCSVNAMLLNPEKTKSMVVATRQKHQRGIPPLHVKFTGNGAGFRTSSPSRYS